MHTYSIVLHPVKKVFEDAVVFFPRKNFEETKHVEEFV